MLRYRVAEFEGSNELCQAADIVLRDPFVDLSVVRNVEGVIGIGYEPDGKLQLPISEESMLAQLRAKVPAIKGLKTVVSDFWHDCEGLLPDNARLAKFFSSDGTVIKSYPTRRHFDNTGAGPLTISARVDPYDELLRTFAARKFAGRLAFDKNGYIIGSYRRDWQSLGRLGLSEVRQNPGDIILFANTPQLTVHQVNSPDRTSLPASTYRPRAIVHTSRIRYKKKK